MEIRTCKKCGFILGTRPELKEVDGVCSACINSEKKKSIDFTSRQAWLTQYIAENITNPVYDCLVGVSGGKDSHMIVKRLMENHGVRNPLLVNVTDEFTHTQAGAHNLKSLAERYDLDTITLRCQPRTFIEETRNDFFNSLNPLRWIEVQLYSRPLQLAQQLGIKLVFYGENSSFEYGSAEELDIFHPASDDKTKLIYMGAIYPYSISDSLSQARSIGFKDLDDYDEWQRQGSVDQYSQIDSIGYIVHLWCKFVKFGFQRVSDMACRMVREGNLTREQAVQLIRDRDYICDPAAKRDFCRAIGISQAEFDLTVDRFANPDLVVKDANGQWRRKDLI